MRLEKLRVLLDLARVLAGTAEGLTLDEMAAHTGVNRRTAERMRDALRDLFPTMQEVTDGRAKRFRVVGGLDSFSVAPTSDELAELDLAASGLEAQGGSARAALLRGLARKVRAQLREGQRRRIDPDLEALLAGEGLVQQAGPQPIADPKLLATLREAVKARRLCKFNYIAANGHSYPRAVSPYGLLYGRAYYLVAPERGKREPVLWRFDRLADLVLGDYCDPIPEGFDLRQFAQRSFGSFQEKPEEITLRFASSVADDVRRFSFHPSQSIEEELNGTLTVRFKAGGLRELAWHLFTWGDAVKILQPPSLRDLMIEELKHALIQHQR